MVDINLMVEDWTLVEEKGLPPSRLMMQHGQLGSVRRIIEFKHQAGVQKEGEIGSRTEDRSIQSQAALRGRSQRPHAGP